MPTLDWYSGDCDLSGGDLTGALHILNKFQHHHYLHRYLRPVCLLA